MKQTVNYSEVTDEKRSIQSCLIQHNKNGRKYFLVHKTSGYRCSGSAATYTEEGWGCIVENSDGSKGGQWFKTKEEAQEKFDRITK